MQHVPAQVENQAIRRAHDEARSTWWFSVVDIVQVLTQQPDFQAARKYWNKLKTRLNAEGRESVTKCHRLKRLVNDTLPRWSHPVSSSKAVPIQKAIS